MVNWVCVVNASIVCQTSEYTVGRCEIASAVKFEEEHQRGDFNLLYFWLLNNTNAIITAMSLGHNPTLEESKQIRKDKKMLSK